MIQLEDYLNEMKANNKSPSTIKSLRIVLTKLNRFKPVEKIKKEDLVKYLADFKGAESSKALTQVWIKKFFRDGGKPELVNWIDVIRPKDVLKPDDVPNHEEVNKMIEATDSHYFKALIAFLFEAGPRISEATGDKFQKKEEPLRYKDFTDTTDGMIVHIPTSKTAAGYRPVILTPEASQYIKNLKIYTFSNDDDEVFNHSWEWMNKNLKEIARAAGIRKRITCHVLRHAAATEDARNGMNEENLRRKYGWAQGSRMPSRYTNLNTQDVLKAQMRARGRRPRDEEVVIGKIVDAPKISIADSASILFKLEEENKELKQKYEGLNQQHAGLTQRMDELSKLNEEFLERLPKILSNPGLLAIYQEGLKTKKPNENSGTGSNQEQQK